MNTAQKAPFLARWQLRAKDYGALLLSLGLYGCSPQPAELGRQIAATDVIVATNRIDGFGLSVAGDESKRIVQAVTSAKRDRKKYLATFGWELQFHAGTNLLAVIRFQGRLIRAMDAQYRDDTGVLQAFCDGRLRDATARHLSQ